MGKIGSEQRPRWLKWLHRIGYVTTALVLIQILIVGTIIIFNWLNALKTNEGHRNFQNSPILLDNSSILFSHLPSIEVLNGDGIRFVVMPYWDVRHYAIALYLPDPKASEAIGELIIVDKTHSNEATKQYNFTIPKIAYYDLMIEIDKVIANGHKYEPLQAHATVAGFERIIGKNITSGVGSKSPYSRLQSLILSTLQEFAPNEDLPKDSNW